jgi:DNA-binding GntR family transcriptional regulator
MKSNRVNRSVGTKAAGKRTTTGRPRTRAGSAALAVVRSETARAGIYERLVAAIFEHRLPPGTKLGEESLAAIFGVTRARVRAVLPRLAHEGLVTLEPNRGAFVAQPTVEQARDVFEARRLIEPGIATRLARQADRAAAVTRLRHHVAAERKARAAGDVRTIVRLSGEFHMLLAELSGNVVLAKSMRELALLTCLIIALYDRPATPSCLGEEHGEITDAIAAGDGRRAAALMVEHLNHVEKELDLSMGAEAPIDLAAALA